MKWEKVAIKDVVDGIFDGPHATPPISVDGGVFLGISNITKDGHLDLSDIKYISKHDLKKWTKRVTPSKGDIVFSYEATLNLYAMIPEDFFGCLGRRMGLIRPNEDKAIGKFLYYYFFSPEWRRIIAENTVTGSTVDRIPLVKFPEFKIELPSLTTQQRIASILSAYDDLIENNQKQIKLLEEAAQRLYKEWFVYLRFPGYENVKVIDGVPEGWCTGKIGEIGEFVRGKTITKDSAVGGNVPVVAGGLEPAYYHNKSNVKAPVITISGSGANAGFTNVYFEDIWASDCSYLSIEKCKNLYYVYIFLKTSDKLMQNLQKGSAQPHVYAKNVNALDILIPADTILVKFANRAELIFNKIANSRKAISELKEARDRLLPKLMNGELEV